MANESNNSELDKKRFDAAVEALQFEIDLFWKRSLFYWGFVGAAFVAFASSHGTKPGLAIIVASFGVVCSLSWSMVNRGSKYWQEFWEAEVGNVEDAVTGVLFKGHGHLQDKGLWLSARRYSASKLTIGLSDYVCILWLVILLTECSILLGWPHLGIRTKSLLIIGFAVFSICYAVMLGIKGRSSIPSDQP
jgi:hypothetical protein